MLANYANQVVQWKRRLGVNPNGAPEYAASQTIAARAEYHRVLTVNDRGEQVTSQALVMTEAPVSLGDAIVWQGREFIVRNVDIQFGLSGQELHREVIL